MSRCNNPNNKRYKHYGGNGVTYDDKWNTFQGFLDDVDSIEGWDENKFMNGELQLDKDIKVKGNKYYSKDNCMWVAPETNIRVRPNYMKRYIALSPDNEYFIVDNMTAFCKEHNLTCEGFRNVADGNQKDTKGWQIRLEDEIISRPFLSWHEVTPHKIHVKTRDFKVFVSNSYAEAMRTIQDMYPGEFYSESAIQKTVEGKSKHFKGHVAIPFHLPQDCLPKDCDMPDNLRFRDLEATKPDGTKIVIKYTDRAKVYKELGIDGRRVSEHLHDPKKRNSPSMKGIKLRYL